MSKKYRRASAATPHMVRNTVPMQAFTFGDPEPIDRHTLLDYCDVYSNGRWYEPPTNLRALVDMTRAAPHHSSAIYVKRNLLLAAFEPSRYLSASEFGALANDYITFGMAYLEQVPSLAGSLLKCRRAPALYTRRGVQEGQAWFVPPTGVPYPFPDNTVVQVRDEDLRQEIYGIPEYLSAMQSAMLNRSATLFRRRYYDNGSHAGFILYMTDASQSTDDVDAMRKALKDSKGPGNFRNLFMYAPNGKKDGIQLIPISDVSAKDDFASIKNVSRDDILAAHRVPPQLLGVIPVNAGGFGDIEKATRMFVQNEIVPLQVRLMAFNDLLGVQAINFKPLAPNPGAQIG